MNYTTKSQIDAVRVAVETASRAFGMPPEAICRHTRKAEVVRARNAVIWAAHKIGVKFSPLGRYFGKHHTTIMHSFYAAREAMKDSPQYRAACHEILRALPPLKLYSKPQVTEDADPKPSSQELLKARRKRYDSQRLKPKADRKPVKRNCMTCQAPFMSEGPHNRLCDKCRTLDGGVSYSTGRAVGAQRFVGGGRI